MKPLQNNFTTPEQSKRLLELGLPADSADLFFTKSGGVVVDGDQPTTLPYENSYSTWCNDSLTFYYPCWSVGRLIEIWYNCTNSRYQKQGEVQLVMMQKIGSPIEQLMKLFEQECNYKAIDFSKLEG